MTLQIQCQQTDVGCLATGICDVHHGYMKDIHYAGYVCHTSRITNENYQELQRSKSQMIQVD